MSDLLHEALHAAGVDLSPRVRASATVDYYTVPGGRPAVDQWHALRHGLAPLGAWPVLGSTMGEHTSRAGCLDHVDLAATLAAVPTDKPTVALERAREAERQALREEWFRKGWKESLEEPVVDTDEEDDVLAPPDFSRWPADNDEPKLGDPSVVFDHAGRPLRAYKLAVVRTADPPDALAHLGFGGFNDCPMPELQIAFARDWHRRFGAVPMAVTHDTLELFLPTPIDDPAVAWEIAQEQYAFCSDIVLQGTETVAELARSIWRSPKWFFWWD